VAEFIEIEHSRFRKVQRDIFLRRLVPDCMSHECKLRKEGDRIKLDACCQYGVDVDIGERDGILAHAEQIRDILGVEAKDEPWFGSEERVDVDFPSGRFVRTRTHGDGCIFLHHDQRGCAIHRASIEGDWDFHGIKPHVCRLFPLSYDDEAIVLSDDYPDYSCAYDPEAPSVYRVGRPDLQAIFGSELVAAMDAVEASVLGAASPSLTVVS
jgi:Fe-S-cluster containining protein